MYASTVLESPRRTESSLENGMPSNHLHDHGQPHGDQCNCSKTVTASQSLDELEFERGIWTAAIDNDEHKLRSLIAKGHLHDRDNSGYTALHYAARNGHLSICRALLDAGIGIDERTHGGVTALHRAAMMGHHEIVNLLLARKTDPFIQDSDGKTALHRAAEKCHPEVCRSLLQHSPTLAAVHDGKGKVPLELASQQSAHYQRLVQLFDA